MLGKAIYKLPQFPLVLLELLLSSLALLDIRHQIVPTDNAIFGISLRTSSYVDPTVHAIGSMVTYLIIRRLPIAAVKSSI
jgi:hypothetical protein